jgi:hypothetical protein
MTVESAGVCGLPDDNLVLMNETLSGTQVYQACTSIRTVNVTIEAGADITFRAGATIILDDGTEILEPGDFTAEIDPSLLP